MIIRTDMNDLGHGATSEDLHTFVALQEGELSRAGLEATTRWPAGRDGDIAETEVAETDEARGSERDIIEAAERSAWDRFCALGSAEGADAARAAYVEAAGGQSAAVEFENAALSIDAEALPPAALDVRDGAPATAAYYEWLTGQLDDDGDD